MVETQTYLISKCNSIAVCINFTHPTYIRIVLNIIKNKLNFDSALRCKKKKQCTKKKTKKKYSYKNDRTRKVFET